MSASLDTATILAKLLLTIMNSDDAKRARKTELAAEHALSQSIRAEIHRQEKRSAVGAAILNDLSTRYQDAPSAPVTASDLYATDDSRQITSALLSMIDTDVAQFKTLADKLSRRPSVQVFNDDSSKQLCISLVKHLVTILEHIQAQYTENLSHCREESFKAASSLGGAVTPNDLAAPK